MEDDLLKQIIERLDILISLNIPPFKEEEYPKGFAIDLLKLCDGENTTHDIVKKTGKSRNQVDVTLNKLRNLNLIKSISKDNKTYHIRVK